VPGVCGVVNEITVRPLIKSHAVEQEINDAFQRNALLDARQITVTVSDGTAHLSGHVQ
jgi:osmotically-inducible protein OsmY